MVSFFCIFRSHSNETSSSSSHTSNDNISDESITSQNSRFSIWKNGRNRNKNYQTDNNLFVNIATQNSREKHISVALKRIEREKEDFDEL